MNRKKIITAEMLENNVCSVIGKENFSDYSNYLFELAFQEAPYRGLILLEKSFNLLLFKKD